MPVLTLTQAKQQLNIDESDTSDDVEISEYLASIVRPIEGMVGPVDDQQVTEWVDGGRASLALRMTPVVDLGSITHLDGTTLDTNQLAVDGATGEVLYRDGRTWFPPGRLEVAYTAGRGGACPTNVGVAARIILQHLWRTQRGRAPARVYGDQPDNLVTVPGFGFLIPNQAYELIRPDDRGPTIG